MTENPWLPIDTMPLNTVGTEVDIKDEKCLYSGVLVSGIRYEHDVIEEQHLMAAGPFWRIGPIDDFTIVHTTGTIRATLNAEWRPHA